MKTYEYIRIELDLGDLSQLNRFSQDGWRLVQIIDSERQPMYAILERMLPEKAQ